MAKWKVEIEGNTVIKTLTFNGEDYKNTWVPTSTGSRTLERTFDSQVQRKYPNTPEGILDILDELDSLDEDEMLGALDELTAYEKGEGSARE